MELANKHIGLIKPFSSPWISGLVARPNLDGLLQASHPNESGESQAYIQVFKTGIIESVDCWSFIFLKRRGRAAREPWESYLLSINLFEACCINALERYLTFLNSLKVEPPIYLFLTLIGVAGTKLMNLPDPWYSEVSSKCIDRDIVVLPKVCIKNYNDRPYIILKDVFDSIWNACGYEKSLNYKEDGSYENWQYKRYTFPPPNETSVG